MRRPPNVVASCRRRHSPSDCMGGERNPARSQTVYAVRPGLAPDPPRKCLKAANLVRMSENRGTRLDSRCPASRSARWVHSPPERLLPRTGFHTTPGSDVKPFGVLLHGGARYPRCAARFWALMLNRVAVRLNRTVIEMGESLVLGARRPASTKKFDMTVDRYTM